MSNIGAVGDIIIASDGKRYQLIQPSPGSSVNAINEDGDNYILTRRMSDGTIIATATDGISGGTSPTNQLGTTGGAGGPSLGDNSSSSSSSASSASTNPHTDPLDSVSSSAELANILRDQILRDQIATGTATSSPAANAIIASATATPLSNISPSPTAAVSEIRAQINAFASTRGIPIPTGVSDLAAFRIIVRSLGPPVGRDALTAATDQAAVQGTSLPPPTFGPEWVLYWMGLTPERRASWSILFDNASHWFYGGPVTVFGNPKMEVEHNPFPAVQALQIAAKKNIKGGGEGISTPAQDSAIAQEVIRLGKERIELIRKLGQLFSIEILARAHRDAMGKKRATATAPVNLNDHSTTNLCEQLIANITLLAYNEITGKDIRDSIIIRLNQYDPLTVTEVIKEVMPGASPATQASASLIRSPSIVTRPLGIFTGIANLFYGSTILSWNIREKAAIITMLRETCGDEPNYSLLDNYVSLNPDAPEFTLKEGADIKKFIIFAKSFNKGSRFQRPPPSVQYGAFSSANFLGQEQITRYFRRDDRGDRGDRGDSGGSGDSGGRGDRGSGVRGGNSSSVPSDDRDDVRAVRGGPPGRRGGARRTRIRKNRKSQKKVRKVKKQVRKTRHHKKRSTRRR